MFCFRWQKEKKTTLRSAAAEEIDIWNIINDDSHAKRSRYTLTLLFEVDFQLCSAVAVLNDACVRPKVCFQGLLDHQSAAYPVSHRRLDHTVVVVVCKLSHNNGWATMENCIKTSKSLFEHIKWGLKNNTHGWPKNSQATQPKRAAFTYTWTFTIRTDQQK